jgi:hypothetical protein
LTRIPFDALLAMDERLLATYLDVMRERGG